MDERNAARMYSRTLGSNMTEISEGEEGQAGMFWMVLGEGDYANADYWRWRPGSKDAEASAWHVTSKNGIPQVILSVHLRFNR